MDQPIVDVPRILGLRLPSPIERIEPSWHNPNKVDIWVKRDDLIHPIISGNKWRKLHYRFTQQLTNMKHGCLSFGGGYSNHLHALAYCCHQLQIPMTAIVRGNYSNNETPMLLDMLKWGADIVYVNKLTYKRRSESSYLNTLQSQYPNYTIIPEGGSDRHAFEGVKQMIEEIPADITHLVLPVGSGGTLAGCIQAKSRLQDITGIAVLKGEGYLEQLIDELLDAPATCNWSINHQYHMGGYAKHDAELTDFCAQFAGETDIALEPVYSGKLFYALKHMIGNGRFATGANVLAIHTGGIQGQRKTYETDLVSTTE